MASNEDSGFGTSLPYDPHAVGIVWSVVSDGVVMLTGRGMAFCHSSDFPTGVAWSTLSRDTRIALRPRSSDGKSRAMVALRILGDRVPTVGTDRVGTDGRENLEGGARIAASGMLLGDNAYYSASIRRALDKGASSINNVGKASVNRSQEIRAGFTAEADHMATFNVEVANRRSVYRAEMISSNKPNSVDIRVVGPGGETVGEYSSKVYATAEDTAREQLGYGAQKRIFPKDQLDAGKAKLMELAETNERSGIPRRNELGKAQREVHEHATDHLGGGGNKSVPRTRDESLAIGNKAAKGEISTSDIAGTVRQRMAQGAAAGLVNGAIGGAATAVAVHGLEAISSLRDGRKTKVEAAADFAVGVVSGAAEGGVKTSAAYAATAGARVIAEGMAEGVGKRFMGSGGPAAVVVTGIDVAMNTVGFASGRMTGAEYARSVTTSVGTGTGGYVGATVGGILTSVVGLPWLGALLGGLIGSMIGAKFAEGFADEMLRGKPVAEALDASFTIEAPYDWEIAYRMDQVRRLAAALGDPTSLLYPGRVLRMPGASYQHAADLLLAHGGLVYAVDFRNWKGTVRFLDGDLGRDGEHRRILKRRTGRGGVTDEIALHNPVVGLKRFSAVTRHRLVARDVRWRGHAVRPLVVYPDDGLDGLGDICGDRRFLSTSDFLAMLRETGGEGTPDWMQDGLSSIPTWDTVQDAGGTFRQGLIESDGFDLSIGSARRRIAFADIMRLIVRKASGRVEAEASLVSGEVIGGILPDGQTVALSRKGHATEFALTDLRLVCPANLLFSG